MNLSKPTSFILLTLFALLTACSTAPKEKMPTIEELLKRPQAAKPQVAVVPTADGRKGGVLPVLSAVNSKGKVHGAVCREASADKALCEMALAQKRPGKYKPAQVCTEESDGEGNRLKVCENVPSYAEHIYLLYGKEDNYQGGAYRMEQPHYPALSLENGEEGEVQLAVVVAPEGGLDSVKIVKSSRYRRLDNAADKHIKQSIFLPKVINGEPVWTQFNVPIHYQIPN